jgi:O-antigen/teichoic acid export membrane protein
VIVDGVATVPVGLLNRFFLQKRLFIGEAVAFVSSTSVMISLAAAGAGAYSFAWGTIVSGTAGMIMHTCLAPFRVRPGWNRRVVRSLVGFGLPLAGASLLVLSVANVDNLVVGAVLGQTLLGYYLLAFRQSSWPMGLLNEAARRVALAGFSRLEHDRDLLSRAFTRGLALLMAATVPACVLLAVYAEPLVRILFGERWLPAAQAIPLLAVFGLLRVGLFVGYDLLVAVGRSRLLAGVQFVWLVTLLPALWGSTRLDGIRGAAAAQALVAGVVITPLFLVVLRRLGIAPSRILAACRRPVLGGLALGVVTWGIEVVVAHDVLRLLLGSVAVLAVYVPIVWPMRSLVPARSADPAGEISPG